MQKHVNEIIQQIKDTQEGFEQELDTKQTKIHQSLVEPNSESQDEERQMLLANVI